MRAELPLGTRDPLEVDGYRVVRRLAQGGQGVVYLARTPDDELVALKLLHPGWLEEPSARERLVKEIGAARTVARFCVAQVLDAKVDGDEPYIVSEFVEGPSLSQHVKDRGPLRGAALDRLAVATATALAAIHRARIVHRDLKPSNVMLGPDGPRVIDFGIARDMSLETTSTGRIVGSPNYMSPEQLSGLVVGPAADVFSWGCTVVFAATGRSPFVADTLVALMYQVVHADPDTAGVPEPLRGLVERCLAKDPDTRPTSEQVLLALLGGEGLPAAAAAGPADAVAPVPLIAAGALAAAAESPVESPARTPVVQPPAVPSDPTPPTSLLARAAGLPDDPTPPTADVPRRPPPPPAGYAGPAPTFPPPPPPYRPYDAPALPPPADRGSRGSRWALGALAAVTAGLLAVGGGLAVRDLLADDPGITGSGPSFVPPASAAPAAAPTSAAAPDDPAPTTTAPPPATPTASGTASPTRKATRTRTATRRPSSSPPVRTSTPAPVETGVPRSFAGVWTGTATQRGGIVTSFDVTMRLGRGAVRGTIASATLGCTGVVDVVGTPTASVLRLHQRTTTSGDGLCALGADITMTKRSANRSAWAWVDDTEPTNTASAVLTRS